MSLAAHTLFFFLDWDIWRRIFCLKDDSSPFAEKFPLIFTTGLLVNHLIILLSRSLNLSLVWGGLICICGLVRFLMRWKKESMLGRRGDWLASAGIGVILVLYYFAILYDPLEAWDARSIWFFHAKMIWSAGSPDMTAGWNHPSLQWSHVDYPKLIPALAAQMMHILGYWNEYAPKFALFLLLIPAIFWIFSFYKRRFSFLFLALLFPFGLKDHLWNGFMDGYIAFYAAVAVLLLGRFFQKRRSLDFLSAISCLALLSNIKNEGMAIALAVMASYFLTELLSNKFSLTGWKQLFSPYRIVWLSAMITPCLIWSVVYKNQWRLKNDLRIGTSEAWIRIIGRFTDGESLPLILKTTIIHDESAVWLSVIACILCLTALTVYRRRAVSWIPALITAFMYYWVIVLIYGLTPHDLNWHLATSAQRTMLTVSSCLLACVYLMWNELEKVAQARERKGHHVPDQ